MNTSENISAQTGIGALSLVAPALSGIALSGIALGWIALGSVAAHAQSGAPSPTAGQVPGMIVELGAGGSVAPRFEGSSDYLLSPYPIVRLKYLRFKNGFQIGGGGDQGFSLRPSFRYLSERSASDDAGLTGLPAVDASLELGGGVAYRFDNVRAFVDVRYGAAGHNGVVGEAGIDLIAMPHEALTVSIGPRVSFADDTYMETYFSVSPAASGASGLPQFSAASGLKSAGIEANARYDMSQYWAFEGAAGWSRLVGDAGSSPITALGSREQYIFKLGVIRTIELDF